MVTAELFPHAATAGERVFHRVQAAVSGAVRVFQAMRNRRTVAKLLDWDDRMLRDIGLTRGDVSAAMTGSIGEDPSMRLAAACAERRAARRATIRETLAAPRPGSTVGGMPYRTFPFPDL